MSNFGQGGIMRSTQQLFTVKCEKIGKRAWYKVAFPPNNQINERIKLSTKEHHKWSLEDHCWHLHIKALYDLIKSYRKSDKIKFEFGEEGRLDFLEQIKKLDQLLDEKQNKIEILKKKNEEALLWKKELEENYQKYEPEVLQYIKPDIKLYPHQVVAIMFLKKVINGLLSLEMGLGKTLASIGYAEMMGFKKILVIVPNSLKFNYFDEVEKFTQSSKPHIIKNKNNKYKQDESNYVIVNYDYFNNKDFKKVKKKFDDLNLGFIEAVVLDECFPYNTLIETDLGQLKIGDIVENCIDCKVLSYNHMINNFERKTILRYLYNGKKETIKINLSNGKTIECTENHKFFSGGNYIKAKELIHGSELWVLHEEFQNEKKNSEILFEEMQCKRNEGNLQGKKRDNKIEVWFNLSNRSKILSSLLQRISNKKKNWEKILFNKLFSKMENATTRGKRKSLFGKYEKKEIEFNENNVSTKSRDWENEFYSYETKKSNVQPTNSGKNETKKDWTNIFIERWKWTINKTAIKFIWCNIWNNIHGNGISDTNKEVIDGFKNNAHRITTNTLQIRYWYSKIKNWYRDRWFKSQNEKMEILGQEKRRNIEIVRVESIEILESGNRFGYRKSSENNKRVYDLEIEDNHNYFADGVLVSNCHMIKNTQSNTYKNIKKLIKEIPSKVFLSGTPAPNRTKELYTVLNLISPLDFPTKSQFYELYCGLTYVPRHKDDNPETDDGHYSGWQQNEGGMRLEELYHKIAPYTYRKRKFEVLKDLPDKVYQKIIIEMTDEQQQQYDKIEEGVANEIFGDEQMSSVNILTIMLRLRQYTSMIKINPTVDLAKRLMDEGEKSVIVDMFKPPLLEMKKLIGDVGGLHTGDEVAEERNVVKNDFQNPDGQTKIFLASISTTKYGLTLTAASKLFMTTLPWSTGEYDQVSDRLHRIGQKDTVFIYPVIIKDTIDEYVFRMIEKKRIEITKVLDNEDYQSNVEESVLSEVLAMLREKYGKKKDGDGQETK